MTTAIVSKLAAEPGDRPMALEELSFQRRALVLDAADAALTIAEVRSSVDDRPEALHDT
jgi:hypothetical protein